MKDFENLQHTQMPATSLRGMTASIIARNKIPVVFCSEPQTLADMAVRIARKTVEDPEGVQTKTTDTVKEPTFMENVFLGIEGIGYETASALANRFKSVQMLHNATVEEFQEAKGVGQGLSEKIYQHINTDDDTTENDSQSNDEDSVEVVSI